MRIMLIAVTSGLALAMVPSCKSRRDNPNHCQNNEGNDWCSERFPDRPFCSIGSCTPEVEDGCMAERPADDACYSPCGDDQTFEDDPSCDGVADTSTGPTTTVSMSDTTPSTSGDPTTMSSMSMSGTDTDDTDATTEPTTETGPTGCVGSEECTDPGNPVCVDEVCAPCTDAGDGDAACAEKDSEAPACGASGECVECTDGNPVACDGTTPVCDAGSSSCVACTYHEQCDAACNMDTGACFGDCVREVDGDGGAEFDTIGDAISEGCVVIVHELEGMAPYLESLELDGVSVALLAADGEAPRLQGLGGNPSLSVIGGANVFVDGLTFSGSSAEGVRAAGASVWLDRSRVINNTGGGLVLTSNANAVVRNCFVGGSESNVAAIEADGATLELNYSTVIGGFGAAAAALRCDGPATINVSNSLLLAETNTPELDCTPDSLVTSATESDLTDIDTSWFVGYALGDFSLSGTAPPAIQTTAEWNTGDPTTDIDGDLRPTVDGTADVAGADIP